MFVMSWSVCILLIAASVWSLCYKWLTLTRNLIMQWCNSINRQFGFIRAVI